MSGPTRYSVWCTATHGHEPMVSESGLWVLHADVEAMRARHVREAVEGLTVVDRVRAERAASHAEIEALRSGLGAGVADAEGHKAYCAALLAALTGEGK